MKKLFFITSIFISSSIFAQSKISIAPIVSIDYGFRKLSGSNQPTIDARNSNEIAKIGFRTGLDFHYRLNKKLTIKSGVRFVSSGYQTKKVSNMVWEDEYDATTGITTPKPNLPHSWQTKYKHYFIEVPLVVRYHLGKKRISYFLEAGFSANIYTDNRIKKVTDLGTQFSKDYQMENNNVSLSTNFSAGLQYQINKKLVSFVQPIFRYGLTPINNNLIKMQLHSFGTEIGIRFHLK